MPDRLSTLWSQTFHIFSGDESESDGIEKKKNVQRCIGPC